MKTERKELPIYKQQFTDFGANRSQTMFSIKGRKGRDTKHYDNYGAETGLVEARLYDSELIGYLTMPAHYEVEEYGLDEEIIIILDRNADWHWEGQMFPGRMDLDDALRCAWTNDPAKRNGFGYRKIKEAGEDK